MIKELKDGLKLYHGSYCQITSPDIAKCLPFKDFGKGFYLTTSKRQAEDFSRLSLRKAIDNIKVDPNQTESFVSCFIYHNHEKLKIFTHKTTDKLWLHCVIAYRNENYYAGKRFLGLECVTTKILCNFSVLHSFAFKKAFYKLFVISFCFHVLIDKIYQLVRVHCLLMTYIRLQRVIKQFNSI